ncbi:DUF971 domain-containing protein [Fodinicurvata sp. EGI_FJ10296]|uniref:DUF971 domain-containing protein n=1 Tax=Fodinicurvata sp. EGI_FJ10296 TaxID=3231908 RepID=UPI003453DE24
MTDAARNAVSGPSSETAPWPKEIRVRRADRCLDVDFDDGTMVSLPAELLRVESPSAEVQGHNAAQKVLVAGKRNVAIAEVDTVGHYAIRIRFDDGHATGLFTWRYLYDLGHRQSEIMDRYSAALSAAGMSRDA